jgi:hypothetical protein
MTAGINNEDRSFFIEQVKDFEPFVNALRETGGRGFKDESAYAGIGYKISLLLYSLVELWVDKGVEYNEAFIKGAMCFTSGVKWMTGDSYLYHVYHFLEGYGRFLCDYRYPHGDGEAFFKKLLAVNDNDDEFERVFSEIDSGPLVVRLNHWFYTDSQKLTGYLGTRDDETLKELNAELFRNG